MKTRNILLVAAATMIMGLASCTDEPIIPVDGPNVVNNPMVKSVDDLVGTTWTYTLFDEPIVIDDQTIDLSMKFGLAFDETDAHLTFPDNVTVISVSDEYSTEEIESMGFAYTYNAETTSGTLQANDLEIPFRYDEADDAIMIDMNIATSYDEEDYETVTIVFHRD